MHEELLIISKNFPTYTRKLYVIDGILAGLSLTKASDTKVPVKVKPPAYIHFKLVFWFLLLRIWAMM